MAKTSEKSAHRVLVVDDEADVRATIRTILRLDGYAVEAVANAEQALKLVESNKFDLIIVDYSMPGMKGDELARLIKERTLHQPILMITAYSEMLDCSLTPVTGVELVLCKPIKAGTFRKAVAAFFPPPDGD